MIFHDFDISGTLSFHFGVNPPRFWGESSPFSGLLLDFGVDSEAFGVSLILG